MLTYEQCAEKMAGARSPHAGRPLQNNTRLYRRGECFAVQLHETDVVTVDAQNRFTLNTGGWKTVTTKDRINTYAPSRVYSGNGVWYVGASYDGPRVPFFDGITVDVDGKPLNPRPTDATLDTRKRQLDRKVSRYIKGFAAAVTAGEIGNPGNGDCFYCQFQPVEGSPKGQGAHRLEFGGMYHLESHFEEGYFVPSLLWRAIHERGYRDPALIWHMTVTNKDGSMAADNLRAYFRKRKPFLLEGATHA